MPSMEYLMLRSARRARLQARVTVMQPFEKFLHMLKPGNGLGGGITRLRDVSGHPDLSSIFLALALSALGRTRFKTPSFSVASMRSRSMFSDRVNTLS